MTNHIRYQGIATERPTLVNREIKPTSHLGEAKRDFSSQITAQTVQAQKGRHARNQDMTFEPNNTRPGKKVVIGVT